MGKNENMAATESVSSFRVKIGQSEDFVEGSMKEVKLIDTTSVLVVKHNGNITAVSNKCTHYGAPLIKGSLCVSEGIIRCPWHGACFNLKNGDIEDFPGLDPLQYFPVNIENGDVYVSGHYDQLSSSSQSSKIKSLKEASSI